MRFHNEANLTRTFGSNRGGRDGAFEVSNTTKEQILLHRQRSIWRAQNLSDYADKKWAIQKDYLDGLVRQQEMQQRIAWLSFSELFGQTAEALCRTDLQSFLKYLESIRNYRETFFRYYTDMKLFESFTYFTSESYENLYSEEEVKNMGMPTFWKLMEEKGFSLEIFPYLNTDDAPRYVSQPFTLATMLNGAMGRLTALLSLMVALLFATIAAFMKYDVR
jgi:hypothetical protein